MHQLIAFDLDGVLYSSEPFLGEAYREAIANVNHRRPGSFARVPTTAEILEHVGWPVPVILERLFPRVEATAVELLYAETLTVICTRVERHEGLLFPDVVATLEKLRAAGFVMAVASNGRGPYVQSVLRAHSLGAYFVELITVDRIFRPQKADLLRAYAQRLEIGFDCMVMIGDRTSDVEAAQAVGCRFIGCDYGHGHRDEIASAGPIIGALAELPAAMAALTP